MKNTVSNILYILLGACICMAPAFYNGFPLVYADTGTYISSGMVPFVPNDRPVIYGLFIKSVSCGFSLWAVIFVQCLILSYVLFLVFKVLANGKKVNYAFILSLIFLTSCTGMGWYAGQLMPDIYTAISILSLGLLLFCHKLKRVQLLIVSAILVFSVATHLSTILIDLLLLVVFFWVVKLKRNQAITLKTSHFILPVVLVLISILSIGAINYSLKKKYLLSNSGELFLMGRLIDSGVLKSFLQEKCPANKYVLCGCIDSIPDNNKDFLWAANSPLYKTGGWNNPSADYHRILVDVLKSPKYSAMFVCNSVTSGFSQLFQNEIGSGLVSGWYAEPSSPPFGAIATHFPNEINAYKIARQNTNIWGEGLNFDLVNAVNYFLLTGSILCILLLFFERTLLQRMKPETRCMILICILGIVLNAFVTATFANVYDRLQARVSWMLLLVALLILTAEYEVLKTFLKQKISRFLSGNN